jgi:hypothetical protein
LKNCKPVTRQTITSRVADSLPTLKLRAAMPNLLKTAYAACLLLCVALASCGKGSSTATVSTPIADFSLTSTPATVALTAGGAGKQISVNAVPANGFSGKVAVSIGGLPAGVTANPATLTLTPGTAQSVTLTAASTTAAGNATLTLTGASGTLTHSATVTTTISTAAPAADFSLTATPATVALTAGGAAKQISLNAVPANGFTGSVAVAISGLPTGVTANPASLTLTPGTAQSVTLTAASTAVAGNATLTLTGTSGSLTHSVAVTATITAAAPATDFSLTATPATVALTAGGAGKQISVKAVPANGFTGKVALSISGLPTGVTASPATLTLTPGTAQSVTLTAASTAAAGNATLTLKGTSGSLTHSITVAVTISTAAPAANFSLTLSPASLTISAGAADAKTSVLATAANSFSGTVAVSISGLPAGVTASPATLTLTPGTAQSVTLSAASSTAAATASITFTGVSGSLTHSASLALTVQPAVSTTNAPDITTYHNDIARDGLNARETILTLSNVNSAQFGKIAFDTVDGLVDAQPLYLANVTAGGKARNVLYVATENDSVYAFDADTGAQIWKTTILGQGETPSDSHGCPQITPQIGITSTPVIDRKQGANGTLFTVGMTKDASGNYHQRLHALDITTGKETAGSPTEIAATYPGTGDNTSNGNVVFDPGQYVERSALLLLNGNIYTAWTSHCDALPYTGWVIAYSESTLQQSQVLNVTPNASGGSIWMSGDGIAADSSGNLYFLDANGTFDTALNTNGFPASGDYGNAMIKLSTTGKLAVADYFETYNTGSESSDDLDFGSGGEILLPAQTDAAGKVHSLVVGAGKDQNIYIGDTSNLGKFNASTDSNIYQQVTGALSGPVFSTPAFFNGVLYYGAVGDSLKAFPITNAKLATAPSSQSAVSFSYPGTTPSISANGTENGIVWALESSTTTPGVLYAYDATNLTHELYNSGQAAKGRDSFGNGNKYITPLIVNGKVYVGTPTGVAVFGLLAQ